MSDIATYTWDDEKSRFQREDSFAKLQREWDDEGNMAYTIFFTSNDAEDTYIEQYGISETFATSRIPGRKTSFIV